MLAGHGRIRDRDAACHGAGCDWRAARIGMKRNAEVIKDGWNESNYRDIDCVCGTVGK